MASYVNKTPLIRQITNRGYAAQASPRAAAGAASAGIRSTALPNKLVVATADSHLPASRISIVFRAGSRFENYENMGASHMLRIAAGLSTKNSSGFAITRNIQQSGGNLHVTSDREVVQYTVEVNNEHLETGLRFLKDVATAPAFKPWELSDSSQRIRIQVASVPKNVRALELLHKAAFGIGLGNSIYCPKYHIGKLSQETMQHFFNKTCTTNRCAVVGVGVDHNLLTGFAQNLSIDSGEGITNQAKYRGNVEIRKDRASNKAHVAIGGQGAGLSNLKEALAFAILKRALGAEPVTKRGNSSGPLGKISDHGASVSAINALYNDSGLFGILISCDGKVAHKVVEEAVKVLKSGQISSGDVKRGKALLKRHLASLHNCESSLISDMGYQAALIGEVHSTSALGAIIDSITDSDVSAAARKVGQSPLSLGAVGNLANVPSVLDIN
ncbi:cytochrome b-c1 complex subunit 2, mitochondrial [Condylostylus longicornis]|uniref:cytochrome b-c1 complex subunit 2, mitochondrial n=1 Tax=Condylostylus longicornis TaxID=2530218 RepID=UPI00244DAFB6|nr:cytochrome b-c1 complex subunit 2, mitochondrial [Condylostylus longicornis]